MEGDEISSGSSQEEDFEFNCDPVKKKSRTLDFEQFAILNAQRPRILPAIKDIGILYNARSTAKRPAMQAAIQGLGLSTGYVDQDTSGNYDPKSERTRPRKIRRVEKLRSTVIFRFKSQQALDYLKSISTDSLSSEPSSSEDDKEPEAEHSRQFVSCNQCRETSSRCNLKRGQVGPCSNCKKNDEICRFILMPRARKPYSPSASTTRQLYREILNKKNYSVKSKTHLKSESKSSTKPKPKRQRPRPKLIGTTSGIRHITITTSFCHPIKFYYMPDPDNTHPCSWCDSPVFGLWGHSSREVEVIPYGGGIGHEEISGGHSEDGVDQTRMCCNCTLERMSIMYCGGHIMRQIKNLDPETLDFTAIGNSLIALADDEKCNHIGAELVKKLKWCNVCVNPAEYNCCACDDDGTECGCGLHLCEACTELLNRLQKCWQGAIETNIMEELIKLWKADLWKRDHQGELRADAEFLISTGELSTRLEQGMEMSRFEDDPQPAIVSKPNGYGTAGRGMKSGKQADKRWNGIPVGAKFIDLSSTDDDDKKNAIIKTIDRKDDEKDDIIDLVSSNEDD